MSQIEESIDTESDESMDPWLSVGGEKGELGGMGFHLEMLKMFWNCMVVMVVQHCEYTKDHSIAQFEMVKMMNMLYEFYLNKKIPPKLPINFSSIPKIRQLESTNLKKKFFPFLCRSQIFSHWMRISHHFEIGSICSNAVKSSGTLKHETIT